MLLLIICLIALVGSAIAFGMAWGIWDMLSSDQLWELED